MWNVKKTVDQLWQQTVPLLTDSIQITRWSTTYQMYASDFISFMNKSGAWAPSWSVTPAYIWQSYYDTTNDDVYYSKWLTNTSRVWPLAYVV